MAVFSFYRSPLGRLLLTAEGGALTGLWMEGQKYYPDDPEKLGTREDDNPALQSAKNWLDRYFAGERPDIEKLSLRPAGTDFQKKVWHLLCRIPYGKTTTYGALAKTLAGEEGLPSMSAQAVGGAVGRNPISVIIPCHRVVGAAGSLTGYAGGLERKRYLLALEAGQGE